MSKEPYSADIQRAMDNMAEQLNSRTYGQGGSGLRIAAGPGGEVVDRMSPEMELDNAVEQVRKGFYWTIRARVESTGRELLRDGYKIDELGIFGFGDAVQVGTRAPGRTSVLRLFGRRVLRFLRLRKPEPEDWSRLTVYDADTRRLIDGLEIFK